MERSCPETCETPLHAFIRTTIAPVSHAICNFLAINVGIVRKACHSSLTARNGTRRAYKNVGLMEGVAERQGRHQLDALPLEQCGGSMHQQGGMHRGSGGRGRVLPGGVRSVCGMHSGAQPLPSNGEAFGHQGGIGVKCDDHGSAEDLRQEHVLALDIPGDRFDMGSQISGAGERLMPQYRQGRTAFQEDSAP